MFYIPTEWYKNKSNESIVHELLDKYLYTDIISEENRKNLKIILNELNQMGETTITENLKRGII